jgi:hypothetical protein
MGGNHVDWVPRRAARQHVTSSLLGNSPARRSEVNTIFREVRWKPLIGHRFDFPANEKPGFRFAVQHGTDPNNSLANFYNCITL